MNAPGTTNAPVRPLVVVPVYNHGATLRAVVEGALRHAPVLVVDDGSEDLSEVGNVPVPMDGSVQESIPAPHPLSGLAAGLVRHERNQGKGAAILTAARKAQELGCTHIITIDADGQHSPADLPLFLEALTAHPASLLIGARDFSGANIPFSSRFGRAFSNFWFKVQTGQTLADTQCGFRAYPVSVLTALHFTETRYSFEVEVLVRASWAGFAVRDVPVSVHYPPRGERISHFKAFGDNLRISLLNTRLTARAMMPLPQKRYAADSRGRISALAPVASLRLLLLDRETPFRLAASVALGFFLGTLFPMMGLQSISTLLLAGRFNLNKPAALAAGQLCIPPLVPALCIEAGHYLRHGRFLTEVSWQTLGYEAPQRLWEWLVGAALTAPLAAAALGLATFAVAGYIRLRLAGRGGERA